MNRIKISPLASESSSGSQNELSIPAISGRQEVRRTSVDDFSLFVPMHYEKNYAYPLIVWLHSSNQSSDQIQKVMLELSMRNYVGVAPASPTVGLDPGCVWGQNYEAIEAAHDSVIAAIDMATMRFNVAPHRVFLAGLGVGGTMSFRLAFERPDLFAGVMSINGPLPSQHAPLRDWSNCRRLPVFWAHGRNSTHFDQEQLCRQLKLLHIAGFSVTLRQYPHEDLLCRKTMSDANNWLMEMIQTAVTDRRTN